MFAHNWTQRSHSGSIAIAILVNVFYFCSQLSTTLEFWMHRNCNPRRRIAIRRFFKFTEWLLSYFLGLLKGYSQVSHIYWNAIFRFSNLLKGYSQIYQFYWKAILRSLRFTEGLPWMAKPNPTNFCWRHRGFSALVRFLVDIIEDSLGAIQ